MAGVTDHSTGLDRSGGRSRAGSVALMVVGAVVIALAGLAVGGCSGDSEASESELPESAQAAIDEYRKTWEDQDIDGWNSTIADDYFYRAYVFGTDPQTLWPQWTKELGARERATLIEFKNPAVPEQVGDNLVVGDGPWVVSVRENWMETGIHFNGTSTYVIVEQDGTMKIASHYYTGTASQPGE